MPIFLNDLDEYIALNYDDFTAISKLDGFIFSAKLGLKRVYTKKDVTYNFKPDSTFYKISNQPKRERLLAEIKSLPKPFNLFNFSTVPFKNFILCLFVKKHRYGQFLKQIIAKYGYTPNLLLQKLDIDKRQWRKMLLTRLYPTKRLLFKICLQLGVSEADFNLLLNNLRFKIDNSSIVDLVVSYLIYRRIFGADLINLAFSEYNIQLF